MRCPRPASPCQGGTRGCAPAWSSSGWQRDAARRRGQQGVPAAGRPPRPFLVAPVGRAGARDRHLRARRATRGRRARRGGPAPRGARARGPAGRRWPTRHPSEDAAPRPPRAVRRGGRARRGRRARRSAPARRARALPVGRRDRRGRRGRRPRAPADGILPVASTGRRTRRPPPRRRSPHRLARVQTPQAFRAKDLLAAYTAAPDAGFQGPTPRARREVQRPRRADRRRQPANLKVTYPTTCSSPSGCWRPTATASLSSRRRAREIRGVLPALYEGRVEQRLGEDEVLLAGDPQRLPAGRDERDGAAAGLHQAREDLAACARSASPSAWRARPARATRR